MCVCVYIYIYIYMCVHIRKGGSDQVKHAQVTFESLVGRLKDG